MFCVCVVVWSFSLLFEFVILEVFFFGKWLFCMNIFLGSVLGVIGRLVLLFFFDMVDFGVILVN